MFNDRKTHPKLSCDGILHRHLQVSLNVTLWNSGGTAPPAYTPHVWQECAPHSKSLLPQTHSWNEVNLNLSTQDSRPPPDCNGERNMCIKRQNYLLGYLLVSSCIKLHISVSTRPAAVMVGWSQGEMCGKISAKVTNKDCCLKGVTEIHI